MRAKKKKQRDEIPAVQGKADSDVGYCKPPAETQFKPGQSGNPAGRPPAAGASVREWFNTMQEWARTDVQAVLDDDAAPVNKQAAAAQWMDARSGNRGALDMIFDRTIGKPTQAVELTGKDGGSLEVNHSVDLSKLSADELRTWRELRIKASAGTDN